MSKDLEELKRVYALSEDESNKIQEQIIKRHTYNIKPTTAPKMVIVGGQPGAGKTSLQMLAEVELLNNVVICNVDNLRDYHPKVAEIKNKHEVYYGDITNSLVQRWNDGLCKYCMENKLNFILEKTFKSGNRLNDSLRNAKDCGFLTEIKLMAVNPRISFLSAQLRYETLKSIEGGARKVPVDFHNSVCMAIPFALQEVQKQQHYHSFGLYTRSAILTNNDLTKAITAVAYNPPNLVSAYHAEVYRPWPSIFQKHFEESCQFVTHLMNQRNASEQEIRQFQENVGFSNVPKRANRVKL